MTTLIPWTPPANLLPVDRDRIIAERAAAPTVHGRYLLQYRAPGMGVWQELQSYYFAAPAVTRRDKERAIVADPGSPFRSRYGLPAGEYRVVTLADGKELGR